ncbi:major facilitator superfamily domain-containing protein [Mycena pura]|uniref:Major facilitator superfamily domain-containing protein n=1 Tax=Mycena pura TaxID=153505 RepID=A0AAD6VA63_9AGAR|nr:major facilitator superfamily domain-containing protein [Mycena pura]
MAPSVPPPAGPSAAPDDGASATATKYDFGFLLIPRPLRHDPKKPFHFGLLLNVLFGFASTFTVANLYYCQPLLIQFSESFGVSYNRVANIPTLLQAGYATGILFITPLGDLIRRRGMILFLALVSTTLTIGLAVTSSLVVFELLSFFVGVVSVTPQIMIPLAADLAPPERRASALSVVMSGLLLGVLTARVIAGVIAQFVTWRVVYYFAIGVQCLVLVAGYFVIPDYPAKNPELSYWAILRTMAVFAYTEPILVQACLVNLASSACFTNFWVTLTFLLGGPPYHYSTLAIGLFGLIGIFGVACAPLVGRVIDRLVPWWASLAGVLLLFVFQAIQVAAGDKSAAVIVVVIMGLDLFRQTLQMSLATSVFTISAAARARLNAIFVLSLFVGQLMGTAAGTQVFTAFGWRAAAALNMGFYAWVLVVIMLRGPHCPRHTWFGFEGGWAARKSVVDARKRAAAEGSSGDVETAGSATPQPEGGEPEKEKVPLPQDDDSTKQDAAEK